FEEGEAICTLLFKAKQDGTLNEALSLDENRLKPEAYAKGNEFLSLYLKFGSQDAASSPTLVLWSNRPNPFSGTTVIPFSIPSSGEVTFTITSVKGEVVKQWSALYPTGYSEIKIDMSAYSGVYYYRIEAGEFTATRKMVILE
ncbi:MAG TPA: T9SS type A sorting domain-containing protein, partial [Phaeodactylibacter sp.]|nr:T9SS type A sorting domain-containing protein [Phaeodactylibacter sp.]